MKKEKESYFKGKVIQANKELEKNRDPGSFWHDSVSFNSGHYLDETYKVLANQLFNSLPLRKGYNIEQKQNEFEILIANLLYQNHKPINVSLNKNDWKQGKYNKISYFIKEMIYCLYDNNLIQMKKGYRIEGKPSRMTRIFRTEELLKFFPEYRTGVYYKPPQLVILHDENKKLKEYKDTDETCRIRSILQRVNDVNSKAEIRHKTDKLDCSLVAIFSEKFTRYGRLHTKGYRHYQGFSGEEREEITINGDSIVELDYKGLHPNLLYATEGIQYMGNDPYGIINNNPIARPYLKQILLNILNSKNYTKAEQASNYWLYKNHEEREQLQSIGITTARPLIDKFFEVHKPISHYFCNGKETGMRTMNKDSKIALKVINHFAEKNIPILCIHDSFIVQEKYKTELFNVMKDAYHQQTGFDIEVK